LIDQKTSPGHRRLRYSKVCVVVVILITITTIIRLDVLHTINILVLNNTTPRQANDFVDGLGRNPSYTGFELE
jgi:hypothetical protein